jgi:peptide/nickel transport system substrate-binding protein
LRPVERAAFIKEYSEKKYKNIIQAGPGAFGKGGVFSYGSYPDIDALYQQQAGELDGARREAILFRIQQLMVERAIFAPIWQLAFINGVGPRVGESGFGRIPLFPCTSPYEDITLKGG